MIDLDFTKSSCLKKVMTSLVILYILMSCCFSIMLFINEYS